MRYGEKGAPGSKDALNGVSVRVPRGTLFMLLGPNGCGKSTLLRTMAGLVTPWSGRLRVQAPRAFVFQNPDHQVIMPTARTSGYPLHAHLRTAVKPPPPSLSSSSSSVVSRASHRQCPTVSV